MTVKTDSVLFSGKVDHHAPMAVASKGNYITLEDPVTGRRRDVFDAMGGAAVVALGHGDEDIVKAIAEAAKTSTYTFPAAITNYHAEKLAKFIIDKSPPGAFASALFTCSGSESNENGMKTVYQYWLERGQPQRTKFLSRKQSYHGYTIGCVGISESMRARPFKSISLPSEITPKVSPCHPYRFQKKGQTDEEYLEELLREIEDAIIEAGPDKVGAFLLETQSGSSLGTVPAVPGYLAGVREICDKYDILMWLDEVMCGTGRASATGGLHCWESYPDFSGPDLQSIGKTLGGGFVTIAGLLISPKVKNVFVDGSNYIFGAQTYHQHSFNCQVALAVQEKIDRLGLRQNMFDMGTLMGAKMKELAEDTEIVGDVRGLGGFWSIEIVKNKATKEPFAPELKLGVRITEKALENGMTSMGLGGTIDGVRGDHVSVAPTFIITAEDADFIATTLIQSVKEVEASLRTSGDL